MLNPNNNRGETCQTDEKHLTNLREYFVGVVKLACYAVNTRLLLRVFNDNLLKYICWLPNREIYITGTAPCSTGTGYICWLPNREIYITGTAPCSTGTGYSTSTVR